MMFHHNFENFVGQPFQQGKTVAVHMPDDLLGDGAVIQGSGDFVPVNGGGGIVAKGDVDHHILLVVDLFFLDANVGTEQKVLDPDRGQVITSHGCHDASVFGVWFSDCCQSG